MTFAAPLFERKIVCLDTPEAEADLTRRLAGLPRPLVFTNGVFDILHRGHVTYLAQARALGGALVVGVNSDASVRMLGKGDDRPVNAEADRMAVLAALEAVDLVVMFTDKTPVSLVSRVHPDIYVKGGDYDIDALEETRIVRTWGGSAVAIPFLHDRSTTTLLKRVRNAG
ncbi:D-glycero-beta-D-manno-heptose 1-phosphate adenylyltransferase [Imbroritus primus]|uniref:D-glycero-beta-D-manno-heptose 1-phosphate adenylyltransferase n=1 Tax=Imbroritus primus TaxID=3058603 RepID=A0ACD3SMC5_9BURK|nr:D-glycero-beta-D-manno-heptose 1-phosphate adenylyltransferase [Burkholderiaceae bacterium PBA]